MRRVGPSLDVAVWTDLLRQARISPLLCADRRFAACLDATELVDELAS